nr:polysaccharide pyruvyl transferase family protein [Aeromicrobium stalagmiti]
MHRRREGLRALYIRAVKEARSLAQFAGRAIWTPKDAASHAINIARSRRGIRRLAPFRPANIVESIGRVIGSREARRDATPSSLGGHAQVLVKALSSEFPPNTHVDLVNVPLHNNCGDSAIWLGQRKLLQALGVGRSSLRSFTNVLDQFDVPGPAPIVLVRGGGYLGDLWPTELKAFFDACRQYSGSRLVFMPQSIGTLSESTVDSLQSSIRQHGDVRLLLRDARSLDIARALFPSADSDLVPDSAQALAATDLSELIKQPDRTLSDVRVIARSDSEGDGSLVARALELNIPVLDFVDAPSSRTNRALRWTHELVRARAPHSVAFNVLMRALPNTPVYDLHADAEVRRAVQLIAGAQRLITDRLHAAIIASILEIDVIAVDTGYGKLRAYFGAWPSPFVTFADNLDAALETIHE